METTMLSSKSKDEDIKQPKTQISYSIVKIPLTKPLNKKAKNNMEYSNHDLTELFLSLSPYEFNKLVTLYNNKHQELKLSPCAEIDNIMAKHKINMTCPNCNSSIIVKDGVRNGVQRFKCTECNKRFTRLQGTFAEKTTWSWDTYVHFIECLLDEKSIDTIYELTKEKFSEITETTLHFNRLKIMDAAFKYPRPKLNGVVQMDETHFHESQKGSRNLIDPINNQIKRKPRKGARPSQYGVMSPEFATVCVAIDEYNHMDVGRVCYGKLELDNVAELCDRAFKNVTFLCTDKNSVFKDYTNLNKLPHYTIPSNFRKIISTNQDIHTEEWLYRNEMIDEIKNYGILNYNELKKLKKQFNLNLSRVNGIHKYLKQVINAYHIGVSSKNLDFYVGFFVFKKNFFIDHPEYKSSGKNTCEAILRELLTVRNVITRQELIDRTREKEKSSTQYVNKLIEHTKNTRKISGNDKLKFNSEDGVNTFNKNDYINKQPLYKLRVFLKLLGVKGYSTMPSAKMKAILRTNDNFQELLDKYLSYDIGDEIEEEDKQWLNALNFSNTKKKN